MEGILALNVKLPDQTKPSLIFIMCWNPHICMVNKIFCKKVSKEPIRCSQRYRYHQEIGRLSFSYHIWSPKSVAFIIFLKLVEIHKLETEIKQLIGLSDTSNNFKGAIQIRYFKCSKFLISPKKFCRIRTCERIQTIHFHT